MRHNSSTHQTESMLQQNPFNVSEIAISPKAFRQIRETVGSRPPESGGALFVKYEDLVSGIPYIREFVFDKGSSATGTTYSIDKDFLNHQLKMMAEKHELRYAGLVHSHPRGFRSLTRIDIESFKIIHEEFERPFFITPIIYPEYNGGDFQMFCYLIGNSGSPVAVEYRVMDEEEYRQAVAALHADEPAAQDKATLPEGSTMPEAEVPAKASAERADDAVSNSEGSARHIDYSRERSAVDPGRLARSKVVIAGAGGSYCLNGMLARSGVGELVDIDPDTVDATNICRQGYLLRQVGMKKVDALGEYIHEINPDTKYTGYAKRIQDLSIEETMEIMDGASLIIAATDSFEAQAFVNRLALLYNVPAIFAGYYEKSLASEIIFWIPGVTEACFRCVASSRYKFQEEYRKEHGQGFSVSSDCNTIFHSELLDAQIGMLAMAILHNDTEGLTFSGWFGESFDQNILQMKVSPEYKSKLFDRVFPDDRAFLFNSVWQHAKAEVPPEYDLCPDCHGRGVKPQNDEQKTR